MQKNGMWLPLIASVGVGAAAYYTMTKNNNSLGQMAQKVIPFVSQMGGNNAGQQSGTQGMG